MKETIISTLEQNDRTILLKVLKGNNIIIRKCFRTYGEYKNIINHLLM